MSSISIRNIKLWRIFVEIYINARNGEDIVNNFNLLRKEIDNLDIDAEEKEMILDVIERIKNSDNIFKALESYIRTEHSKFLFK